MTTLAKILMTVSVILSGLLIWVTFKKVKVQIFVNKVKEILADGQITAEEALGAIQTFLDIFKP